MQDSCQAGEDVGLELCLKPHQVQSVAHLGKSEPALLQRQMADLALEVAGGKKVC